MPISKHVMVKAIFFDLWGTLLENGVYPSPVKQVKYIMRIKEPFEEYILRFEKVFMTQTFENLTQGFEAVAKEFQIDIKKYQIEQLVGLWNKKNLLATPYPETIKVLQELKGKYKLVLISNTDCFSAEPVLEKFKMNELFDHLIFSYKEGSLKTDKDLFSVGLAKLKLKTKDVVMVGDSVASDMRGAENAGIKGILIDRRNRQDYPTKIVSLDQVEAAING
jgi:HAD superfamily hydrolase (TIGR01549 family)